MAKSKAETEETSAEPKAASCSITATKSYNCWQCDYFQGLDPENLANGWCRRRAPTGLDDTAGDWARIANAGVYWCGDFKTTTTPFPNPPPEEIGTSGTIVNIKGYSCWLCTYFNPINPEVYKNGFCQRRAPRGIDDDENHPYPWCRINEPSISWCGEFKIRMAEEKLPDEIPTEICLPIP
jgi:hypothetical protein